MKGYTAIQKKLLVIIYTLWKNDVAFDEQYGQPEPFQEEEKTPSFVSVSKKQVEKKIVPLKGRTTQDKHSSTDRSVPSFVSCKDKN